MELFLESLAKPFLILHLIVTIVAFGFLGVAVSFLVFKKNPDWDKGIRNAVRGSWGYIVTFITGLLIYPVFRVKVRAEDFDVSRQWATALFEIKEHTIAIALFAAIGILLYNYMTDIKKADEGTKKFYMYLVMFSFLAFVVAAIIGFILTGTKSI